MVKKYLAIIPILLSALLCMGAWQFRPYIHNPNPPRDNLIFEYRGVNAVDGGNIPDSSGNGYDLVQTDASKKMLIGTNAGETYFQGGSGTAFVKMSSPDNTITILPDSSPFTWQMRVEDTVKMADGGGYPMYMSAVQVGAGSTYPGWRLETWYSGGNDVNDWTTYGGGFTTAHLPFTNVGAGGGGGYRFYGITNFFLTCSAAGATKSYVNGTQVGTGTMPATWAGMRKNLALPSDGATWAPCNRLNTRYYSVRLYSRVIRPDEISSKDWR